MRNLIRCVRFPSPCGEWVRKARRSSFGWSRNWLCKFPSPCGEWVRKVGGVAGTLLLAGFPSPCGEWVRKVTIGYGYTILYSLKGFRPLAGNGLGKKRHRVSNWFRASKFPSPCGEWVRKGLHGTPGTATATGFRPLAGNGLGKTPLWLLLCLFLLLWVSVPLRGMG